MIKMKYPKEFVVYTDSKWRVSSVREIWFLQSWAIVFMVDDSVMVIPRNRITYAVSDPDKIEVGD